MSRIPIVVCVLSLVALCLAQQRQQQQQPRQQQPQQQPNPQYTQKYDNFDSDALVRNERILLNYYKCIMDQGPCTRDGKLFKRVLPEALKTSCGFCSTKQAQLVRKLLLGIHTRSEPRFNDLLDKFDGGGAYRARINKFIFGSEDGPEEESST